MILWFGTGCSQWQVDRFRQHAARGDHAWIATQPIDCPQPSTPCSQLHLIKGEACFHLATTDGQSVANYICAADHLEQGLALAPAGKQTDRRSRYQEWICESLIHLERLDAPQPMDRIMTAATTLHRLVPQSVPAKYYLFQARMIQAKRMQPLHNSASRLPACIRLKRTTTDVLSMIQDAERDALADWDRFADRYQRLAFELGETLRTVGCR